MARYAFQERWWRRLTFRVFHIGKASLTTTTGLSSFPRVALAWAHELVLLILSILWFILEFIIDYFLLLWRKYSLLRLSSILHLLIGIAWKFIKPTLVTILNILRCSWVVFYVIFWTYCSRVGVLIIWISLWIK